MLWAARVSGVFSAVLLVLVLSPSFQSFPPAEAIRSSHFTSHLRQRLPSAALLGTESQRNPPASYPHHTRLPFRQAPSFRNAADGQCPSSPKNNASSTPIDDSSTISVCDPSLIHIALTLDDDYLRGSIAAVHSILHHARCPSTIFFHFLSVSPSLAAVVRSAFADLNFNVYSFDPTHIRTLISTSVRHALEQPLNYARNYLPSILPDCVSRVIYLDSDLVVVDDIARLWRTDLAGRPLGAPEYCHANFTKYFTDRFWADGSLSSTFSNRRPCYFNTGVMVLDLERWRQEGYARKLERWMEIQKEGESGPRGRIYELGSLPPFLLVFAGDVAPIEHRWNQHGLGGDNVRGSCRELHPGPVSLLHWSGSGKPWVRLDSNRPCPLDALWAPYDLYSSAA